MESIIILVPSLSGGGQERMAIFTAELLSHFYDVHLVIFSDYNTAYKTDLDVINLNLPPRVGASRKAIQQFKRIHQLRKLRKKIKPRFVYSLGNTANITNVLSRGQGRSIISYRGFANVRDNLIERYVTKKADAITCISQGMLEKLISVFPEIRPKTYVLHNGLDIQLIETLSNSLPQNVSLPSGFKYVSAGRLTDVKGYRQLLRSFKRLLENHDLPDTSLIILGEGDNRVDLENLIDVLHIQDRVFLLGFQANPYSIFKQCQVYVLSSTNEGFANVILESMACGLPIISTACLSGPAEILGFNSYELDTTIHAEYGIIVPTFLNDYGIEAEKETMLADAMHELYVNASLRKSYILKSKQRTQDFSPELYTANLIRILKRVDDC
jgi:glycosyltransferase involved in cell wall biosynthesis